MINKLIKWFRSTFFDEHTFYWIGKKDGDFRNISNWSLKEKTVKCPKRLPGDTDSISTDREMSINDTLRCKNFTISKGATVIGKSIKVLSIK